MPATFTNVFDPTGPEFAELRAKHLAPDTLLELVRGDRISLVTLPIGAGKSFAADQLLGASRTYEQFDLVVYTAPTWRILNERAIVRGEAHCPVPWELMRPRPVKRCGPSRDALLSDYERSGCTALGKEEVCGVCPEQAKRRSPCDWPNRFERLAQARLIFCTEQQVVVNRSLLAFLKLVTGAERVLLVMDEAKLLDIDFEVTVSAESIKRFRDIITELTESGTLPGAVGETWARSLKTLLVAHQDALGDPGWRFPAGINRCASEIQRAGVNRWGGRFRYLGYDLVQFTFSRGEDRWRDETGGVRFIGRPYLGDATLILSAHLRQEYVVHRLGLTRPLAAPFEGLRVRHPGTTVFNIKNRIGAEIYFERNHKQILDFFAVLIARNIRAGRTTLLVAKKGSKERCAEYLQKRLRGWGIHVEILHERLDKLGAPDPARIALIHYGMMGVNAFEHYESCYCLNSMYIPPADFIRTLQDCEPARFRVGVEIATDSAGNRHVRIPEQDHLRQGLERLGDVYLRKLEVDPAIQAVGRVRFLTRPREVVFFQMHDLTPELGDVVELRSLEHARTVMSLPAARDLDRGPVVDELRARVAAGKSIRAAAAEMGLDKQTAWRRLRDGVSQKPSQYIDRKSETLDRGPAKMTRRGSR